MTTKILALTDALGNLVRFILMPGHRFDTVGVAPLIDGLAFDGFIADKAFDSNSMKRCGLCLCECSVMTAKGRTVVKWSLGAWQLSLCHCVSHYVTVVSKKKLFLFNFTCQK